MNAPIQSSNESARPTAGIFPQQPDLVESDIPIGYFGTGNPRHLRVLAALLLQPLMRKEVDQSADCSNALQLIDDLEVLGLEVPCRKLCRIDRDGRRCYPGEYSLIDNDRKLIREWLERTLQVQRYFQESH